MGLILDTSAVIGLVERGNEATSHLIAADGDVPLLHVVSLGELHTGVARAITDGLPTAIVDARRHTLAIAEECKVTAVMDPAFFGAVAAEVSRKVSHNDMWIAAAALHHGATLITEDRTLAEQLDRRPLAMLPGRLVSCRYVGE